MLSQAIAPRRTLVDALLQGSSLLYHLLVVVAGSLLMAALAQVSIPLPFTPVPITGQTYGVLLIGTLLGSRRGALSMLLYIIEGGMGLPFFAQGASGWAKLLGPTGGYLVGFVLAAYVIGWMAERGMDRRVWTALVPMLVGEVIIFACGVSWLAHFVGWDKALPLGLYPFIPGDVIKTLLAALTLPAGWKMLGLWGRE